jgi:hypothetical protein
MYKNVNAQEGISFLSTEVNACKGRPSPCDYFVSRCKRDKYTFKCEGKEMKTFRMFARHTEKCIKITSRLNVCVSIVCIQSTGNIVLSSRSSLGNMARKQCFLICSPSGNMARKQCFLVCSPSGNMARKQCSWFVHL